MKHVFDDGGRCAAGYKGFTGDCATRAIAIAAEMPYQDVYDLVNRFSEEEKPSKRRRGKSNARTGVHKHTMDKIMSHIGWTWVPTMFVGSGCKVHLCSEELPSGRIIARISRHYCAVIDGVLHDTHNCAQERSVTGMENGIPYSRTWKRAVYGYWHG